MRSGLEFELVGGAEGDMGDEVVVDARDEVRDR